MGAAKRQGRGPYVEPVKIAVFSDKVKSKEYTSHTDLVDQLAAADKAKTKAEEKIAAIRSQLDEVAAKNRRALEDHGTFTKTIVFIGSKLNACYQFKDAFKAMDVGLESKLQMALGNVYEKLFTRKKEWKVRKDKMEELRTLLGDKANDFLEQSEWIEPVDEFREKRFDMRGDLAADQIQVLDGLLGQISARPTLTLK